MTKDCHCRKRSQFSVEAHMERGREREHTGVRLQFTHKVQQQADWKNTKCRTRTSVPITQRSPGKLTEVCFES